MYNKDDKLDFYKYQVAALKTARSSEDKDEIFHLLLGMAGEVGEVLEKAKKIVRDKDSDFSKLDTNDLTKELGDILWYVAVLATYFGISLEDVAELNILKLKDRQKRGVIGGSGDNR